QDPPAEGCQAVRIVGGEISCVDQLVPHGERYGDPGSPIAQGAAGALEHLNIAPQSLQRDCGRTPGDTAPNDPNAAPTDQHRLSLTLRGSYVAEPDLSGHLSGARPVSRDQVWPSVIVFNDQDEFIRHDAPES